MYECQNLKLLELRCPTYESTLSMRDGASGASASSHGSQHRWKPGACYNCRWSLRRIHHHLKLITTERDSELSVITAYNLLGNAADLCAVFIPDDDSESAFHRVGLGATAPAIAVPIDWGMPPKAWLTMLPMEPIAPLPA